MLINGKQVDAKEKIDIINPVNNTIIDYVPMGSLKDVKTAIMTANKSQKTLEEFSSRKIFNILYDVHHDLTHQLKDFAKLITLETGKPIRDSMEEMKRSAQTLQLAAEESKRIYGETVPLDACIGGKGMIGFTLKIPLGVVAAITPFNYPVNLAIHKIAPALAAKNAVVFKPSHKAPLAALKLSELMDQHLPDGAINTLTGNGKMVGDALLSSKQVHKISFTGSVKVGSYISQKAGMKKLTLELGGNDPLLVLNDANIDNAVTAALRGSYLYSGQVCIAVKRIIVQKDVADEFTDKLTDKTKKLKMGDPLNPETEVGSLIDEHAAITVENVVKKAINHGAELLCGGRREGAFYEPTVLDNVSTDMEIVQSETFGPISPIIRVTSVDEAIKMANQTQYGLQAGVFTSSIENAKKAMKTIEAGTILINKQSTFRTDNMPFGGFKMSGMGKEGVRYAVNDMTRTKLMVIG